MPKSIYRYFIIPCLKFEWKQDKAGVYVNVEFQEGIYYICASGGCAEQKPAIGRAVVQLEEAEYTIIVGSGKTTNPNLGAGGTFMFKGNGYPESPEPILAVGGAGQWADASLTENGMTSDKYFNEDKSCKGGENGLPASGSNGGSGYKVDATNESNHGVLRGQKD